MAAGKAAFTGATTAMIHEAILGRAPSPPSSVNQRLPQDVDRIIGKALEKDRDLRYQHAADMRADLKRLKRDTESGRSAAVAAPAPRCGPVYPSILLVFSVIRVVFMMSAAASSNFWLQSL